MCGPVCGQAHDHYTVAHDMEIKTYTKIKDAFMELVVWWGTEVDE